MSRYIDADALIKQLKSSSAYNDYEWSMYADGFIEDIENAPSIDIVRCGECKHRPIKEDANGAAHGFNLIAPNELERCPCLVEDGWYSWMPEDNFYCGFGEREGE